MWGNLSAEMTGLSFTIAAGPRQHSHSRVSPLGFMTVFYCLRFEPRPQPGGQSPRIYTPQENCGSVIPPFTGFPFRRLRRLEGLL
jgi:hypothetical protein